MPLYLIVRGSFTFQSRLLEWLSLPIVYSTRNTSPLLGIHPRVQRRTVEYPTHASAPPRHQPRPYLPTLVHVPRHTSTIDAVNQDLDLLLLLSSTSPRLAHSSSRHSANFFPASLSEKALLKQTILVTTLCSQYRCRSPSFF